jgi:flagellar protein FlaG
MSTATATSTPNSVNNEFRVGQTSHIHTSSGQLRNKAADNQETPVSFPKNEIMDMTEALNEYTQDLQTNLGFSVREEGLGKQIVVELKNTATNEVIKQFPPEELLEIKARMEELVGLIFDQSV